MPEPSPPDPLDRFARQAARARQETPPEMDVRDAVLYRLAQADSIPVAPMAWLSVAAVGAAAWAVILAIPAFAALTDPLGPLFQLSPLLGG